jgi:hypothetical protein
MGMSEITVIDVRNVQKVERSIGRPCTCCNLPDEERHELHVALLSGASFRNLAERFAVAIGPLYRHYASHFTPQIFRMLEEQGGILDHNLMSAERVILDLGQIRAAMKNQAVADLDPVHDDDGNLVGLTNRDQVNAAKTVHAISRTALELTGHLKGNQTNIAVVNSTAVEGQIAPVIDKIMAALADHPEAQMAVVAALSGETVEAKALPTAE